MVGGVDLYEPQFLALFVFGGFVILSSIVYIVSAFSMQEKSYEEAIAEQRARMEKEQGGIKETKPKKKYSRKKKERERNDNSIGHQDHMQEEILPAKVEEVVEEAPRPPPKAKSPKAKKESKKAAAAAANAAKEPAAPKASPKAAAPIEEKIVPKVQQVVKAAPPAKPVKEKKQKIIEEPIIVQKKETIQQAAPPPKPQVEQVKQVPASPSPSKAKKSKPSVDQTDAPINARSVIAALKSGKLSDSEIQKIAEVVQQRQHGSNLPAEDWIKANQRSDPIAGLKKQLQEKEQALHNEILLAQSSSQKVKEIRAELVHEKSRGNQNDEHYKEKMEAKAREVDALHIRMRQTHEAHAQESQTLQTHITQLQGARDESNLDVVKQLREENARLKTEANHAAQQKEQIMGAELGRLNNELQKMQGQMAAKDAHVRQSDEIRRSQEAKTAQYDQQIQQYEQQLKQYEAGSQDNVNALSKRLSEVSEELRKSEARSHTLQLDMEKGSETLRAVTQERDGISQQITEFQRQDSGNKNTVATLEAKLKESTAQTHNLDSRVRSVESKLSEEEKLRLQKEEELKLLKNDKTKLEAQINDLNKKVEDQVQKSAPNGDMNDEAKTKEKMILVTEHEKSLGDKVKTIETLQKQLEGSTSEMEKLKKDVEKQTKKNNDLREKNWKAMEALNAAEKSSADKVAIAVKSAKDDSQGVVTQQEQLAKNYLSKLFPTIRLDSKLDHKNWLAQFEQSAYKVVAAQSAPLQKKVKELSSKLTTVDEEKTKLSTQCQHYQTVLGETEGILHKLQSSVESEAKKWQEKLKVSDAGAAQAKRENASLKEDLKKKGGNDKAVEENNRLTKELAASKASTSELEKSRQSASTELAGVKQQLTQLQKDLVAATQRADKGSADNVEANQLKAQLLKEQEQVTKLTNDLSACSTVIQGLKESAATNQKQDGNEAIRKEVDTSKKALAATLEKLTQLQTNMGQQLKESQAELEKATAGKTEAEKSVGQLKEQLDAAQKSGGKSEEQEKEIATMKAALTKEKGLTKDLGSAAGKLQGALKKMQQALMDEKKTTAALKAQMAAAPKEGESPKAAAPAQPKTEAPAQPKAETESEGSAI